MLNYIASYYIVLCYATFYTSSAAQGGGDSFKHRKRQERYIVMHDGRANPLMNWKVVGTASL